MAREPLTVETFAFTLGVELGVLGAAELVEVETFAGALFVFEFAGSTFWQAMDHDTIAKTISSLDSLRAFLTLEGSP